MSWASALLVGAGAIAHHTVVQRLVPDRAHVPANLALAGAAVGVARAMGASWDDVGLDPKRFGSGVRWGVGAAVPIVGVVAAAAALPKTRAFFRHDGAEGHSSSAAAYEVLVRIPFATATAEEIVFRSAIGAIAERRGRAVATGISSVLFGLWHVVPTLETPHTHPVHQASADRHPALRVGGAVVGSVVATAVAGTAFSWLRRRSGSILAPIIAHAALNAAGYVATRQLARSTTVRASPAGVP